MDLRTILSDVKIPVRVMQRVGKSESPEFYLTIATVRNQMSHAKSEKRKEETPEVVLVKKALEDAVLRQLIKKASIGSILKEQIHGFPALAKQVGSTLKAPHREIYHGIRDASKSTLDKALLGTVVLGDAAILGGAGKHASNKDVEQIRKEYGSDAAKQFQKLHENKFYSTQGHIGKRIGQVAGDIAAYGFTRKIPAIPLMAGWMGAQTVGSHIGGLVDKIRGKSTSKLTSDSSALLSAYQVEAKRLRAIEKAKGMQKKASSIPINLLAALVGLGLGTGAGWAAHKLSSGDTEEDSLVEKALEKATPFTPHIMSDMGRHGASEAATVYPYMFGMSLGANAREQLAVPSPAPTSLSKRDIELLKRKVESAGMFVKETSKLKGGQTI